MNPVLPSQLSSLPQYAAERPLRRPQVLVEKDRRRVALGPHLTIGFENARTVRYQIEEILRVEEIATPEGRAEQCAIYNDLFAHPGLSATLMIEIPDREARRRELPRLQAAPRSIYLRQADGRVVFGVLQGPDVALAGVHFVSFPVTADPVAIGVVEPEPIELPLSPACRRALAQDLAAERRRYAVGA